MPPPPPPPTPRAAPRDRPKVWLLSLLLLFSLLHAPRDTEGRKSYSQPASSHPPSYKHRCLAPVGWHVQRQGVSTRGAGRPRHRALLSDPFTFFFFSSLSPDTPRTAPPQQQQQQQNHNSSGTQDTEHLALRRQRQRAKIHLLCRDEGLRSRAHLGAGSHVHGPAGLLTRRRGAPTAAAASFRRHRRWRTHPRGSAYLPRASRLTYTT